MYSQVRLRRNRQHSWQRSLLAENTLSVDDLVLPLFVIEGANLEERINSMPDVLRYSIDRLLEQVRQAVNLGVKSIALFPKIDNSLKDEVGTEASNPDNLICRAVRAIKQEFGDQIGVICDIALDPYTHHGHDGILNNAGYLDNDKTIEALSKQALTLAQAGCDIVAPSDMMDGRVGCIRNYLDQYGFYNISILAYSVKYASSFYGPFRDAVGSLNSLGKSDKKTYQMDFRNSREASREAELDIVEGADIIMVKPGMPYLDIIFKLSAQFDIPVFAYQVSGEYSMLKYASLNGALDYNKCLIEALTCFKRAGASAILTYGAIDAAQILKGE